ncbi:MAG: LysM domain-containing protein, partial [Bacteroidota bacterium]
PVTMTPQQQEQATPEASPGRRTQRRAASAPAQKAIEDEGELTVHTVRRGETIQSVATRYSVTPEQIRKWNSLKSEFLSPGTELYVFVKK